MAPRERRVAAGVALAVVAMLGWIITQFAVPFTQHPRTTEDLTAAWIQAGPTRLGEATTVSVPPNQTLVAFLVGTDLFGIAGTTGGNCTASSGTRPVDLGWPVLINSSLTGVLRDRQDTVAIAGWTNRTDTTVRVEILCATIDSTVQHYVAVPTITAVVQHRPWFQPWAWIALAAVGIGLIVSGFRWVSPPNR